MYRLQSLEWYLGTSILKTRNFFFKILPVATAKALLWSEIARKTKLQMMCQHYLISKSLTAVRYWKMIFLSMLIKVLPKGLGYEGVA